MRPKYDGFTKVHILGRLRVILFAAALLAGLMPLGRTALAAPMACLPGIPCITNAAPNDPAMPDDGPNAAGKPNADKSESAACDADFMNQIYARAWLEAQREQIDAGVVVRKPDSVLELSCFDKQMSFSALHAGKIFSDTTAWSNRSVPVPKSGGGIHISVSLGQDRLDASLSNFLSPSLNAYTNGNFSSTSLGGLTAMDYTPAARVEAAGTAFECDMMDLVHFAAKCTNFAEDNPFRSFQAFVTADPRLLPPDLACSNSEITAEHIALAGNQGFAYVNFDPVQTFLTRLDPAEDCGAPVASGISYICREPSTLKDIQYTGKVCANPACFYQRSTDTCVKYDPRMEQRKTPDGPHCT